MAIDWQGRCSRLVGLLLPTKQFLAGEFEALNAAEWALLEAEFRGAAKTDARVVLAEQELAQRKQIKDAALAKLSADERAALGI